MKNIIASIFFLIILTIGTKAQEANVVFKHITSSNGLSSNVVNCIFEDSKGLIWIATNDGLNVYDGTTIEYIYRKLMVKKIIEDPINSNLYLATNSGLVLFDRKKHKFSILTFKNKEGKTISEFYTSEIKINRLNELFIASRTALYIVNPDRTDCDELKFENDRMFTINAILFHKNGSTLAGVEDGLYEIDRRNKKFLPISKIKNIKKIQYFFVDSQENLWICTLTNGVFCFERGDLSTPPKHYHTKNGFLITNRVISMVEISKNNYYIINQNGGLVHLNTNTNETKFFIPDIYNPKGINTNTLSAILKDSSGNIWIGSLKKGINFIDNHRKKFEHYYMNFKKNGLFTNNIRSFCQDSAGTVWVGTDAPGTLNKFNRENGTFKSFKVDRNDPDALHGQFILELYDLDKEHLLLGTLKRGIEIFNKETEKFTHLYQSNKKANSNNIQVIHKDSKGNLWVASRVVLYKVDLETITFEPIDSIQRVRAIIPADENHLWLATFNQGLLYFDIKTHKYIQYTRTNFEYYEKGGISSNMITAIAKDSKGNMWIGTRNGGLNYKKLNSDTFINITKIDGLANNNISAILIENDSTLWISTIDGLSKYNVNSKTFRNFNVHDGLQDNQFGSYVAMMTINGELYFGGRNGFNLFDPKKIVDNPTLPKVMLTDFKLFNKSAPIDTLNSPLKNHISETKVLTLQPEHSTITFEYVGINYSAAEKNQYAYILEGFEKEWNYVGNKREVTYTNIPAGKYTFRVIASNNDGKWNTEGVSLELIILPTWWNTWWFKILIAIVLLGGSILFYYMRLRKMKARQMILKQNVYERTKDLQEANIVLEERQEEINQQNEKLEAKQNELLKKNQEIEIKKTILEEQKKYLNDKHEEVVLAYNIVEDKNRNIRASISYAKNIQNAILPTVDETATSFNSFILFRPKEIVSGDFYWMSCIDESTCMVAAIDCTGHGVPGAFMTMIGNRLLNSIVNEQKIHSPKEILMQMHIGVKKALKQDTSENDDGMDICLCKIEKKETVTITFSGAKRPLFYYNSQTKTIQRIKGCLNAIGGNYYLNDHHYENTEIQTNKGDAIYLTSDGYIDQNDPNRKSFGVLSFSNLLVNIAPLSTEQQKIKMDETLDTFMDKEKQRDDITVIGIKF